MFHISYGLQWRQGLRYIAVITTTTLGARIDDITTFLRPLKGIDVGDTWIFEFAILLQI